MSKQNMKRRTIFLAPLAIALIGTAWLLQPAEPPQLPAVVVDPPLCVLPPRVVVYTEGYQLHLSTRPEGQEAFPAGPLDLEVRSPEGQYRIGYNQLITTGAGQVTVTLPFTPTDTYTWRAKGLWSLAVGGTQAGDHLDVGILPAGDIGEVCLSEAGREKVMMGDNVVDIIDFSRLKRWFGVLPSVAAEQGHTIERMLSNVDAEGLVDVVDFNLLKGNFGEMGYDFGEETP